jgi:hypothetical protein
MLPLAARRRRMTDHGLRGWHLLRRLEWMQTHYPWSVLWILFMVGMAMVVTGLLFATFVVAVLIIVVLAHAFATGRGRETNGKD